MRSVQIKRKTAIQGYLAELLYNLRPHRLGTKRPAVANQRTFTTPPDKDIQRMIALNESRAGSKLLETSHGKGNSSPSTLKRRGGRNLNKSQKPPAPANDIPCIIALHGSTHQG